MRVKEITVNLDMTVQAKQYNSTKAGATITVELDEEEQASTQLEAQVQKIQARVRGMVLREIYATVLEVYGSQAADYVVNQSGRVTK